MELAKKYYAMVNIDTLEVESAPPPSTKDYHVPVPMDSKFLKEYSEQTEKFLVAFHASSSVNPVVAVAAPSSSTTSQNDTASNPKLIISSRLLYNYTEIIRIITEKFKEAEAEERMKIEGLIELGFKFKWNPSKVPSQLEKLLTIEYQMNCPSFASYKNTLTKHSLTGDDTESLVLGPNAKKVKKFVNQLSLTTVSSSSASGLHLVKL